MATENYWKEKYADVHLRLTNKIAELEKENAELKEALKTLAEGLNIRQQTLQEIKAIAESPRECILSEVSCCNICERLDKITHLITKAEGE